MRNTVASAAGQLLIGGFDGPVPPPEVEAMLRDGVLGGIILFKRNLGTLEETAGLVERLVRAAPPDRPPWMAIDQEGGRVQRLGPPFPQLPAMRTVTDPDLAEIYGATLGEALSTLGFTQDYAPVLDVDTNPDNPVIGDRSFSRDPEEVARLGLALARGLERAGVAACGKHFPGHGDTAQDSHLELPRLPHTLDRLESVELVPFRAAARAGIATIMTAHVLFPALDPDHPATLSEKVITPILRSRLGYRGVIVSDDLEMKAVADHYGIEDAAVRAVRAGCDQLLICHQPALVAAAHAALVRAAETGALAVDRLFDAADRVAELKARFPSRGPDPERLRLLGLV